MSTLSFVSRKIDKIDRRLLLYQFNLFSTGPLSLENANNQIRNSEMNMSCELKGKIIPYHFL
jgi:hypothetical protein